MVRWWFDIRKAVRFLPVCMVMLVAVPGSARAVDWLQYIASYGDLIRAFGANAAAGQQHYVLHGQAEGRQLDAFDENQYLANYADLRAAFGTNGAAATIHYITHGFFEGRTAAPLNRNVLLIIADDMGVDVSNFYPGTANRFATTPPAPVTPNLAALASRGVTFSNAWAYMECSPTRATIFTGRYGFRTGIGQWIEEGRPSLSEREFELPEAILAGPPRPRDLTFVGKWHLSRQSEGLGAPNRHGWPHYIGPVSGGGLQNYFNYSKDVDGVKRPGNGYATTDQVNDALNAIRQARAAQRSYFVVLSFNTPHIPYHLPPLDLHNYDFLPPYTPGRPPRPYYEAMVQSMDTEIGRLMREVDLTSTTVIFLGDNGTPGDVIAPPYQGGKSSIRETGIRVPMVIAGAGVTNPGRIVTGLASSVDLYPTILELTGIKAQSVVPPGVKIDGVSLLPYLSGAPPVTVRATVYSEKFRQTFDNGYVRAIRNMTFKLVTRPGGWQQLFNLAADPLERTNLLSRPLSPVESANLAALSQQMAALLASR